MSASKKKKVVAMRNNKWATMAEAPIEATEQFKIEDQLIDIFGPMDFGPVDVATEQLGPSVTSSEQLKALYEAEYKSKYNAAHTKADQSEADWKTAKGLLMQMGMATDVTADYALGHLPGESKYKPMKQVKQEKQTKPENDESEVEMIRQSLVIERIPERMRIIAIATDTVDESCNVINTLKCSGEALHCYAHNQQLDSYYVSCVSHYDMGNISIAYRISSQGMANLNNVIALPDALIEKKLSPTQKKALASFRENYPSPRYLISFMQAISC
jgi:hypothetical protein